MYKGLSSCLLSTQNIHAAAAREIPLVRGALSRKTVAVVNGKCGQ